MIPNAISVTNAKGGVLKSSISAAIAALAAEAGWNALLVDTDPQGDAAVTLGFSARSDAGSSFAHAVETGGVPQVIDGVRERLDVIASGPELARVHTALTTDALSGRPWAGRLEASIAPLAQNYDIVVFDMAPSTGLMQRAVYSAVRGLITPTPPDRASVNGVAEVLTALLEVRQTTNPQLQLLGVVCGPVPIQATAQARELKETLADLLGDETLIIEPFIRSAPIAAELCRRDGLLPHELETAQARADEQDPWWRSLREGRTKGRRRTTSAPGLATDYQLVVTEILKRFVAVTTDPNQLAQTQQ